MRAALISLPPLVGGDSPVIAGKTICHRQLDFALKAGCQLIILHGHGTSPEAIALRQRAEAHGARFQLVTNTHALIGAIGEKDSLLVLQTGVLPENREALEALSGGERLLVVSAGAGVEAGFERIDLERAWGGALMMPGGWLKNLANLPEDCEPAPSLLRIGLQNNLAEIRLADDIFDGRTWQLIVSDEMASSHEQQWLKAEFGGGASGAISQFLARQLLKPWGALLASEAIFSKALLGMVAVLFLSSIAAAFYGFIASGFILLALLTPIVELFLGVEWVKRAPFGSLKQWPNLRYLTDIGLVICAILAINGVWYHMLFAPIVLGISLILYRKNEFPAWAEILRDRAVIALALALGVSLVLAQPAIMCVAAICLAANLLHGFKQGS